MNLKDGIAKLLLSLQAQSRSPNTIKGYKRDLVHLTRTFGDSKDVATFQYDEIVSFIAKYSRSGKAPGTVNRMRASINSFFQYLVDAGHLEKPPFRKLQHQKVNHRPPTPLEPEDRDRMFEEAEKRPDIWLLMHLYLGKGLRLSEALALNRQDVERQKVLRIEGKGLKVRLLDVTPDLRKAINRWLPVRESKLAHLASRKGRKSRLDREALFVSYRGSRLSPRGAEVLLGEIFTRAGFKVFKVHWLRHAFGRHLKELNVDVRTIQECLGHADLRTTQIYTQVTRGDVSDALSRASKDREKTETPA